MKRVMSEKKFNRKLMIACFKLFLIISVFTSIVLISMSILLINYERKTENYALTTHINLLQKGDYKKVYRESKKYFNQFNSEEVYIDQLKNIYESYDLKKTSFSIKKESSETYKYYDCLVDGIPISTIEIIRSQDGKRWVARTQTLIQNYKIETFDDSLISVNNINLTDIFVVKTNEISEAYSNLKDKDEAIHYDKRYFIDNIIELPSVTSSLEKNIIIKEANKEYIFVAEKPTASELKTFEKLIEDTAKLYCKYITKDEQFTSLKKYLHPKTTFYDAIRSFNNSFFSTHTKTEFKNISIYDIGKIKDNGFIGHIKFDYIVYIGTRSQTYPNTYQMTFLKTKDGYLLTNLTIAK